MVSLGSIALIGLGIVLLGGSALKIRGPQDLSPAPVSDTPIQENPQIQILKDAISGVSGFIKTTFPPIFKPVITHPSQTRGPNSIGIFGARGTLTTINPFTGQRIAIGGSSKFQQITGSNFALNQALVTQGGLLKLQATNIIKDLQGQLKILEANTV